MRDQSVQLWDAGHNMLELIFEHALEPVAFDDIRRARESIQQVTTFFHFQYT